MRDLVIAIIKETRVNSGQPVNDPIDESLIENITARIERQRKTPAK